MLKNNNWIKEDFWKRTKIIKEIYFDIVNSQFWKELLFKWWTSLSLFYWLERFSEDLDFNLIDEKRIEIVVNWIYWILKSKWYKLSKIYRDWTNVVHIDLFYKIWKNDYTCQLEFFKNNYWIKQNFELKKIYWIPVKLLDISENFAHKCCAYLERWNRRIERSWKPKWRDLLDILFYLHYNFPINLKIIFVRTKITTKEELFIEILKNLLIKHKKYHKEFFLEITNFWYWNNFLTFNDFINSFIWLVNLRVLHWKFSFNQNYIENLKEDWFTRLSNFIVIQQEDNLFYTIFFKDKKWNKKKLYSSKKLDFIEKFVEDNFWKLTILF